MAYREGKVVGIPHEVMVALQAEEAEQESQDKPKKKEKEAITIKE